MESKRQRLIYKINEAGTASWVLNEYPRVKEAIQRCENGDSCSDASWCGDLLIELYERYNIECEEEKRDQEEFNQGGSGNDYFIHAEKLLEVMQILSC